MMYGGGTLSINGGNKLGHLEFQESTPATW